MGKLLVASLIVIAIAAFGIQAGEPGTETRPGIVVVSPTPVEPPQTVDLRTNGLAGRNVDFSVPPSASIVTEAPAPSFGSFCRAVFCLPVWALDKTLDLTAGTLNAGGQILNIGTDTALSALQAGSGALVSSGEVLEFGATKMTEGANDLTQ